SLNASEVPRLLREPGCRSQRQRGRNQEGIPEARPEISSGSESQQQTVGRKVQRDPGSLRGPERRDETAEIRSARSELEERRRVHAPAELGRPGWNQSRGFIRTRRPTARRYVQRLF